MALHLRFSQTSARAAARDVSRRLRGRDQPRRARQHRARGGGAFRGTGGAAARAAAAKPGARLRRDRAQVAGKNAWLWVMHHGDSAVFRVDPSRRKRALAEWLGEHLPDFWISDRYGGHKGFASRGHRFCLAHLIRDAQYAVNAGDTGFPRASRAAQARLPARRHPRPAQRSQLAACRRKFVKKLSALLRRPAEPRRGRRLQRGHRQVPAQPLSLRHQGRLAPTNNGSERALRPCVSFRKVTGGFRTPEGAPFYADGRSVLADPPPTRSSRPSRPSPSPSRDTRCQPNPPEQG